MHFNNGLEKAKFKKAFERLERILKDAGISDDEIDELFQFDWLIFKGNRNFARHNQSLEATYAEEDTHNKHSIINKFIQPITIERQLVAQSRYGWIDDISDEQLFKKIRKLTLNDLETITLRMEGYKQQEIADIFGVSQKAISKRIDRIKKYLNFF